MKKETKEVGRELRARKGVLSREGSLKKREVSKHQETLSLLSLCEPWNHRGQHNREEK